METVPAINEESLSAAIEGAKSDDPVFLGTLGPVLTNQTAIDEAASPRERAGFIVHVDNSCDDWDYEKAADYLLQSARTKKQFRRCLISGGKCLIRSPTVELRRNQQFALYCGERVAGENICALSAGSDGIDGNSPAAGAIADGTTLERAKARGLDLKAHLNGFNAYPFFEALGDAIVTGPTGNNLRDLRILLAG